MLGHDYMRRHNEVVRCIHMTLCSKYGIKKSRKLRTHSVQEVIANENAEIRVDTRIKTDVKIKHDRPDLFVFDKKKKEITLIEIGITNLDILTFRRCGTVFNIRPNQGQRVINLGRAGRPAKG